MIIDIETGKLKEFNKMAYTNLGYTKDEFQSLKISDFEIRESMEEVHQHINKIVKNGADMFETQHRSKDGKVRNIIVKSSVVSIACGSVNLRTRYHDHCGSTRQVQVVDF